MSCGLVREKRITKCGSSMPVTERQAKSWPLFGVNGIWKQQRDWRKNCRISE
jgi:hypothetical protein